MCKAMEDMRNEAEQIGIEKGMAKGMAKGLEEGLEKGKKDQTVKFVLSMLADGSYSYEQIARITELTVEEVKALDEKRSA